MFLADLGKRATAADAQMTIVWSFCCNFAMRVLRGQATAQCKCGRRIIV